MEKVNLNNKVILITGVAGFIGANLVNKLLLNLNSKIIGIDNLSDYYDTSLKDYRLKDLYSNPNFIFKKGSISDKKFLENIFEEFKPEIVINLAAQAGVRYSIENPDVYIESNLIGFYNILECSKKYSIEYLIFASSSSVYGENNTVPYNTEDKTDCPVSLYAATKKSNELLAYSYSKLYNIPITGLRFFTVYGPAGRPDMAYFSFTKKLINKEKIKIFNYGNCKRDFTYIDDIVDGIYKVMTKRPDKKVGEDGLPIAPYSIYNIGNSKPVQLLDFINILSDELKKEKLLPENFELEKYIELVSMQPGDVVETYADTSKLEEDFCYKPKTSIKIGLRNFVKWYKDYYK